MTPLDFLTLLYAGVTAKGWVEFRFLKNAGRHWMPWPAGLHTPELFTPEMVPAGKDAYFGVALRKDQSDGKAANCLPTHLIWCDVDLVDHPELTGGQSKDGLLLASAEELAEYKAALLAQCISVLAEHGLSLRAAVDSGHGVQLYLAREASSDPAETERFNKALAHLLGGDQKSTDIARILRVPGTWNRKTPERELTVAVMYEDTGATVTDAALAALPLPEKPRPEPAPAPQPSGNYQPTGDREQNYAQRALWGEVDALRATGEGNRNDRLNIAAVKLGSLVASGLLDEVEVKRELTDAALAIGLERDEVEATLRSGLSYGKANPRDLSNVGRVSPRAGVGRGTIGGKEDGQADGGTVGSVQELLERLPEKPSLAEYRDLVLASFAERELVYRYHQVWRSWWIYQQGVYVEVPDEVMAQQVDLTLQSYGFTLKNAQVTEVTTKLGRDPLIGSRDVDQGAWELNTRSGILSLEDGELYEHDPAYFSIIQSAAQYRPGAVAHDWQAFLNTAVPSREDQELLQMFAGLCLTGDTSPQKALLLIGEGGTGKGTFTRVLHAVLGNLATASAIENIKDGSFLVGMLVGKRMCVVSELPRAFDWLPFKRVVGEDVISVDVKNKSPYATKLDMKLIILSNVMPHLGEDAGNNSVTRRLIPVAFDVRPAEPDPTLESRLTHPDELAGVLNWMIDGLRLLQSRGMRFPSSDMAAVTREIIEESNRVITFLRDECRYTPEVTTTATELYAAYRAWCGQTGHKPLSSTSFAKQLLSAGKHFGKPIERTRVRTGTIYRNVETSTAPGGWEEEE